MCSSGQTLAANTDDGNCKCFNRINRKNCCLKKSNNTDFQNFKSQNSQQHLTWPVLFLIPFCLQFVCLSTYNKKNHHFHFFFLWIKNFKKINSNMKMFDVTKRIFLIWLDIFLNKVNKFTPTSWKFYST